MCWSNMTATLLIRSSGYIQSVTQERGQSVKKILACSWHSYGFQIEISFLCHRYSYAYCRRGLYTFAAFCLSCFSLIQDKPVSGVGCRSPPANLSFQKIQIGGNSMAYNKRLREYLGTLDRRFICCADKALAISIGLAKKDQPSRYTVQAVAHIHQKRGRCCGCCIENLFMLATLFQN